MKDILALEVLGGPMDGLRVNLTENIESARIGRQVGNNLALAFDMTISRWHASIKKEGRDFYLVDEKSVSGTWIKGKRIEKSRIEAGMTFLLGGTIIEVFTQPSLSGNITIGDEFFENPINVYKFSNPLKDVWNSLFRKENEKKYCSIAGFIQQPPFYNLKKLSSYNCIQRICAFNTRSVLSDWINQCEIKPSYRFMHTDGFFTSPRMWHVLDVASNGNTEEITFEKFIEAVINEKRSLPARIIIKDKEFLNDLKNGFKTSVKKPAVNKPKADLPEDILLSSLVKFETIISGFIEDALYSGMTKSRSQNTKTGSTLRQVCGQKDKKIISSYLEKLEKNLVAILAAHRDSARVFEREIGKRINSALIEVETKSKGLFPISDSDKNISKAVRSVLKESELEGLTDRIVRQIIKNKITP